MKKQLFIAFFVLFCTEYAKAQTAPYFEALNDASTGLTNPDGWFYSPLAPVERAGQTILPVIGYFGEVPELAGSANGFYFDENGNENSFPFPIDTFAYAKANDPTGNLYIGTANGLYMETNQGWEVLFGTEGKEVKILSWNNIINGFIFSEQDREWLGKAHTALYFTSGDTKIQFYDILAVAINYAEFQGKGVFGFGVDPGEEADVSDFGYIVDLSTMTEDTTFNFPDINSFEWSGLAVYSTSDELWVQSGSMYDTYVYRDSAWLDTNLGLGNLAVIDNEVYLYSSKINPDFSTTEVIVAGDQHASCHQIQKFQGTWYFTSQQVTWMLYGPLSLPLDEFWGSTETECLYSSIARISFPTGIDNQSEIKANVYPNPANEYLKIEDASSVDFYNQMGQLVLAKDVNGSFTLDIADWQNGLYYYSLEYISGEKVTGTIVVQ